MGSARRGAPGEPRCADHRRAADELAQLGPTGGLPVEARSHVTRVGGARRSARGSRTHLGFAGDSVSAARRRRRSGASPDLGITCLSSRRPGAELGRTRARVAA
jgi:hypothetical protein